MKEVMPCPIGVCVQGQKIRNGKRASLRDCILNAYVKSGSEQEIESAFTLFGERCPYAKRLRRTFEKRKK